MYQIAIVEDEDKAAQTLTGFLNRYEKEYGEVFRITRFSNGYNFLTKYQAIYDIVFMDIEMPSINGMETAERLREMDQTTVLIFVTNLTQYAIRGYEVDAMDYILKPVTYGAFAMKMHRALKRVQPKNTKKIIVSAKTGDYSVAVSDIQYIESSGHTITYHTEKEVYQGYGTLKAVEEALPEEQFFRCNSGILLNLDYVTGIQGTDVLLGELSLPVSRSRKKGLVTAVQQRAINRGR